MDVREATTDAKSRWQRVQDEHRWIAHVVQAYQLLTRNHGNQYAGAITYFSFVALFPLLLLAVSITGFVLSAHPGAEAELFTRITDEVPGQFGQTISESVQTAIDKRAGVGLVGLVGVLLTGLGWIGNLREAIDAVWGRVKPKRNFFAERGANLLVLGGLGLGLIVSLGLTVIGTSLTDQLLAAVGLGDVPGAGVVLKVLGIAIAVAGDSVVFYWLLVRLPDVAVDRRTGIRGALLASVGFEILKIVGTYTIAHASDSKTAGPFVSIIAVLVWIQLVVRFMLFSCAWMATVNTADRTANSVPVMPTTATEPDPGPDVPAGPRPAVVGASLVGIGAVAGAAVTASVRTRRVRRRVRRVR